MSKPFTARYDGYCEVCGENIDAGELVCYDADDVIVHVDCWEPPKTEGEPKEFTFDPAKLR